MKPGESFIFPKEEVLAHKECQRLLDLLGDERLKSIARLKMMGIARCLKMEYRTNEEVAEQLGQFVRTVERKLGQHVRTVEHKRNLIRLIWADEDRLARGD